MDYRPHPFCKHERKTLKRPKLNLSKQQLHLIFSATHFSPLSFSFSELHIHFYGFLSQWHLERRPLLYILQLL